MVKNKSKGLKVMFLLVLIAFVTCKSLNEKDQNLHSEAAIVSTFTQISTKIVQLSESIAIDRMKENVLVLANDSLEGRRTGSIGQHKSAHFIQDFYKTNEIPSPKEIDYLQTIPCDFFNNRSEENSENVIAYIEGTTKKDEVVVISAHYDHLGLGKDGQIYNGADDNGSGTVALMELAKLFQKAKKEGYGSKRSILFLHVTGEEIGLYGSKFYVENPIFPLENTVANLNVDMIGRVDKKYENHPAYIYLVGSKKLSTELHNLNETINDKYVGLSLDYKYDEASDPLRIFYRSDHYNFAKNNIPVIFFFSGLHEDYHKPSDTVDKLDFELIKKRSQLIFLTAWEIANRNNRLVIDKKY